MSRDLLQDTGVCAALQKNRNINILIRPTSQYKKQISKYDLYLKLSNDVVILHEQPVNNVYTDWSTTCQDQACVWAEAAPFEDPSLCAQCNKDDIAQACPRLILSSLTQITNVQEYSALEAVLKNDLNDRNISTFDLQPIKTDYMHPYRVWLRIPTADPTRMRILVRMYKDELLSKMRVVQFVGKMCNKAFLGLAHKLYNLKHLEKYCEQNIDILGLNVTVMDSPYPTTKEFLMNLFYTQKVTTITELPASLLSALYR